MASSFPWIRVVAAAPERAPCVCRFGLPVRDFCIFSDDGGLMDRYALLHHIAHRLRLGDGFLKVIIAFLIFLYRPLLGRFQLSLELFKARRGFRSRCQMRGVDCVEAFFAPGTFFRVPDLVGGVYEVVMVDSAD